MFHQATVAVLLSRSWRVRKRAQQAIKKLLSSLGASSLAHGLLGELCLVINKHKVTFNSQISLILERSSLLHISSSTPEVLM